MCRQCPLGRNRTGKRIASPLERHQESVAQLLYLVAPVPTEHLSQQRMMTGPGLTENLPGPFPPSGGAFDVRQQEGDGARREGWGDEGIGGGRDEASWRSHRPISSSLC